MIDKKALRQLLDDNCQYGLYDGMPFYIIPSWDLIRQCNQIQGLDFSDTRFCSDCNKSLDDVPCKDNGHQTPYLTPNYLLEFERLLGYIKSDYTFPITENDVKALKHKEYYKTLIDNGQKTFINFDPNISEVESEILQVYNDNFDDDPIYWINDHITDNISEVEWGFYDEYRLCDECRQIVLRTSPNSYHWQPDYYTDNDGYRYCKECAIDMLEDNIQDIQNAIDNDTQPKSLSDIFDLTDEWHKIPHPYGDFASWENGLHNGQNDDPLRQGKIIRMHTNHGIPIFECCFITFQSQFDISWDTYIRINPELSENEFITHIQENLDYWLNKFSDDIMHNGKFPYDNATLAQEALKQVSKTFNSLSWDNETGKINVISTDDFTEYQNLIK